MTAKVTRSGGWWAVEVSELRGDLDLSTRDTATLLGVSHQRVSQIARA